MPLEFRRQRDGSYRDTWFGAFEVNGKRYGINLGVKIGGVPPESRSLREKGDGEYEASRARALEKLAHFIEEARQRSTAAHLVEKLYEIKTGERMRSVKLNELGEEWAKIPRKHKPNQRYAAQCLSTLGRFVGFVREGNPKLGDLSQVTRTIARAFLDAEAERGVTAKTWNDTLKLLRATFRYLLPAGGINPFMDTPTKETETVFRKPFSPEELGRIMEAARDDDFIRPIIVTGMCTAMRRGDCCLLKWKDVDLARRFITVKTAKTGVTVSIPIFPMLEEELEKAGSRKQKAEIATERRTFRGEHPTSNIERPTSNREREGYVFPDQAEMYVDNPDGITWRVKKVLAMALGALQTVAPKLPEVSGEEARRRGLAYLAGLPNSERTQRMRLVFDLYMDKKPGREIRQTAGVTKGSVSGYLNAIETAVGCQIVRGRETGHSLAAVVRADSGLLGAEREGGQRRASLRDFHSFRVTWVTIALTGGVPLELVQKVTGHKTTDIVLKHYFQPGREAFRQALNAAMPKLLTAGEKQKAESGKLKSEGAGLGPAGKAVEARIREAASSMPAKEWEKEKERLMALLGTV